MDALDIIEKVRKNQEHSKLLSDKEVKLTNKRMLRAVINVPSWLYSSGLSAVWRPNNQERHESSTSKFSRYQSL